MIGTHASFKGILKAGDVVRVGVDQKRETVLAVYGDSFRTTHPTVPAQTWTWGYTGALLELLPPPGDAIGPACEEEFKAMLADMLDSVSQSVKKLNAALDEALARLPRKTRTLTKAEAEALLTEKLGESVRIK